MKSKHIDWKCPHCGKAVFIATPDKPERKKSRKPTVRRRW